MDLAEAGQRIFKRHWALILVCLLIGLAAPVVIERILGVSYTASARVDLGPDAHSGADSTSIGDMGLGLATSPQVLATAVKQAKVSRSVNDMILNQVVQVTPVGTSGVLDVTVTDPDARASAAIANSVATQIVQQRDQAEFGSSQQLLDQLRQQSASLSQQIAAVVAAAKQTPWTVPGLQAQQNDLVAQRVSVDQQVQQLSQTLATAVRPRVIDASAKEGQPPQSELPLLLPLGALLGLIVGVAIAAAREAAAPTLDRHALARRLAAPLLGRLPRARRGVTKVDPWVTNYVAVAAEAADVGTVAIVPVGAHPADVTGLAAALDRHFDDIHVVPLPLSGGRTEEIPPLEVNRTMTGIVVVAPTVVKSRYLTRLERHLAVTRQPVLGVIAYRGRLGAVELVEVPLTTSTGHHEATSEIASQIPVTGASTH